MTAVQLYAMLHAVTNCLCCRKHYKEYLVDRINKAKLDPLPLYDNITVILTREEKRVPEREGEESDEDYRERLIEVSLVRFIP